MSRWGAACRDDKVNGLWKVEERNKHIHFLELKAEFYGIKCFLHELKNCEILLQIDNITALANINKIKSF